LLFSLSNMCPYLMPSQSMIYIPLTLRVPKQMDMGSWPSKWLTSETRTIASCMTRSGSCSPTGSLISLIFPRSKAPLFWVAAGSIFRYPASRPEFLKEDYSALFNLEAVRCTKTEDQYIIHMNRIRNDPDRNFHTFLFLLPEGMAFTDDFAKANASPSVMDHTQRVVMQELRVQMNIGGHPVSQMFSPDTLKCVFFTAMPPPRNSSRNRKQTTISIFFSVE
jgi:hypothetical protein